MVLSEDLAISNNPDEPQNLLAILPSSLLLNHLLPVLDAVDLVRLGSCCRALHAAAFSDDVWRPLCEALGWGCFPRGNSWQACFSSRRRMLCVECGAPSRYVFALLECRLCERCEHRSPKYGLVTALEAAERYGVPFTALASLLYHETCGARFYLRSAVETLSSSHNGSRGGGIASTASTDEDEDEDEYQRDEELGEGESSDSCGDSDGAAALAGEGGAVGRRAEEKAARKAAKKAAKEAQRQKRQLRNTLERGGDGGRGGRQAYRSPGQSSWPSGGSSGAVQSHSGPRHQQQQLTRETSRQKGGDRGRGRTRGAAVPASMLEASGSPTRGCRASGPLLVLQDDDGDGSALPLEGQSVLLSRNRGRGGVGRGGGDSSGKGRGGHGSSSSAGVGTRAVKLKSGWAAEREALMAAWGQFGISGLVLAS
ncbi:hypothetical protein Vafri_21931 [Volvox africanus]|uniref:F-box domain-containing protein n=1 Tax=Volvox africanus TaxID=51714 RepID=A0A8J4FAY4_9CHLO|nr:hypothetical protein Vafri_21931 [Volvox africanus]